MGSDRGRRRGVNPNTTGPVALSEARSDARRTERLRLVPIAARYAPELWEIHQDEGVARWYPFSREQALRFAERMDSSWRGHGVGKWLAYEESTGALVGRGGPSWALVEGAGCVEIGWALCQEVWGRGYAIEIGRAGLDPPPFHRRIEETLERSGLGFAHLRSTAFMQTLAAYLPALIDEEGVFRLPAGAGRVAWVDTSDISAVAFRALIEGGHEVEAYPITGPERSRWRRWPSCSRWPRGHMTYSFDSSAWKGVLRTSPRGGF